MRYRIGNHTIKAVVEGNWRVRVGIEERAQGFGIESQLLELALDLFEAFLQLAVRNRMGDPVRREACNIACVSRRQEESRKQSQRHSGDKRQG